MFVAKNPQRAVDQERGCEVASVDREHVRYRDDSAEVLFWVERLRDGRMVLVPVRVEGSSPADLDADDLERVIGLVVEGWSCLGVEVEVSNE